MMSLQYLLQQWTARESWLCWVGYNTKCWKSRRLNLRVSYRQSASQPGTNDDSTRSIHIKWENGFVIVGMKWVARVWVCVCVCRRNELDTASVYDEIRWVCIWWGFVCVHLSSDKTNKRTVYREWVYLKCNYGRAKQKIWANRKDKWWNTIYVYNSPYTLARANTYTCVDS